MRVIHLRTGLILTALLLISASCILPAAATPTVTREAVSAGDGTVTITYNIDAEQPFALGIVESIPSGWEFAASDDAVSSSPYFEVDREEGKIAFFVCDATDVSYHLKGSGDGITGFVTEWVDLCELTPDKNEGRERWNTLGASSSTSGSTLHEAASQASPGFGICAALFGSAVAACAIGLRRRHGGDEV